MPSDRVRISFNKFLLDFVEKPGRKMYTRTETRASPQLANRSPAGNSQARSVHISYTKTKSNMIMSSNSMPSNGAACTLGLNFCQLLTAS